MVDNKKYGQDDASFKAAGSEAGVQKLVEDFYAIMASRPYAAKIYAMHPRPIDVSIDKLARFLCGWLGGPKRYSEKYGGIAIPPAHAHLPIDQAEMQAWLDCMQEAVQMQDFADDFGVYLLEQLSVPAGRIVQLQRNRQKS